jgi:hypothetical protein
MPRKTVGAGRKQDKQSNEYIHASSDRRYQLNQYIQRLHGFLDSKPINIDGLRSFSRFGFVNNTLRRKIWPILLGLDDSKCNEKYAVTIHNKHKYYDQINKDVARSLFSFDVHKNQSAYIRHQNRISLARIIQSIFSIHPNLHYIQGFHDICSVFLHICADDEHLAFEMCQKLSVMHIRDHLRGSLDVVIQLISAVFPLLSMIDRQVHDFLQSSGTQSFLTLSWILTWFAHNVDCFESVARIFDFLLSSHPSMSIYLTAAVIVHLKFEVLKLPCEMSAVHQFFQDLPEKRIDFNAVILHAHTLFQLHPPAVLYAKSNIILPIDSVHNLKSVTDLLHCQISLQYLKESKAQQQFCLHAYQKAILSRPPNSHSVRRPSLTSSNYNFLSDLIDENGNYCGQLPEHRHSSHADTSDKSNVKVVTQTPAPKSVSVKVVLLASIVPVLAASVSWFAYNQTSYFKEHVD